MLPDDALVKQAWLDVSMATRITTDPPAATVAIRGYDASDASWYPLGQTPLENIRIPFGLVQFQISKDGFQTVEASGWGRNIRFRLDPPASVPPGMVRALSYNYQPRFQEAVTLDDYWIDRLEVTNRQFKSLSIAGDIASAASGDSRSWRTDARCRGKFEGGHAPSRYQDVMKEVLDWFDRFLGPVRQ